MDGKTLREKVSGINEVLKDVSAFLEEYGLLDGQNARIIESVKDSLDKLFYIIPLKKK